jgi:hypothetical protein
MRDDAPLAADVEIAASVSADELRFESAPDVRTRYPGAGERDSGQTTTRRNIDAPVRPGRTYRRVFASTRISSRLVDPADRRPEVRRSG